MADAKPFWSALYHSLTTVNAEDYEDRSSSIYKISTGCTASEIGGKLLRLLDMVARDGVEPPTPAFSGLRSIGLTTFSINNLTRRGGQFIVTTL